MSEACHEAAHAVIAVEVRHYFERVELLDENVGDLGLRGATHVVHPIQTISAAQDRIMICKAGYTMDKILNPGVSYFAHILHRGRGDFRLERKWFDWIQQQHDRTYDRLRQEKTAYEETPLDRQLQRLTRSVLLKRRSMVEAVARALLLKHTLSFDQVRSLCGHRSVKQHELAEGENERRISSGTQFDRSEGTGR